MEMGMPKSPMMRRASREGSKRWRRDEGQETNVGPITPDHSGV